PRRCLPKPPSLCCCCSQRHDRLHFAAVHNGINPLVAIANERRAFSGRSFDRAPDTIEVCVDKHITGRDAQFCQKPLGSPSSFAHEDPPDDGFVLCRVLADDQHPCRAVQPPSMEDGSPFHAKLVKSIYIGSGYSRTKVRKGSSK